jgi:hypothetical protein
MPTKLVQHSLPRTPISAGGNGLTFLTMGKRFFPFFFNVPLNYWFFKIWCSVRLQPSEVVFCGNGGNLPVVT